MTKTVGVPNSTAVEHGGYQPLIAGAMSVMKSQNSLKRAGNRVRPYCYSDPKRNFRFQYFPLWQQAS